MLWEHFNSDTGHLAPQDACLLSADYKSALASTLWRGPQLAHPSSQLKESAWRPESLREKMELKNCNEDSGSWGTFESQKRLNLLSLVA